MLPHSRHARVTPALFAELCDKSLPQPFTILIYTRGSVWVGLARRAASCRAGDRDVEHEKRVCRGACRRFPRRLRERLAQRRQPAELSRHQPGYRLGLRDAGFVPQPAAAQLPFRLIARPTSPLIAPLTEPLAPVDPADCARARGGPNLPNPAFPPSRT